MEGVDYYFRSEERVRKLSSSRFIVRKTRHIWQAIDSEEIYNLADAFDVVIYDIHPELVKGIMENDKIMSRLSHHIVRVFLQPATIEEIQAVKEAMGESPQIAAASIMTLTMNMRASPMRLRSARCGRPPDSWRTTR